MAELEKRFGRMVAAHRRLLGMTQEALADKTGVSVDMISKIEIGATGARFPNIEKIAAALAIDPAELFTAERNFANLRNGIYGRLAADLATLSDEQLLKVDAVVKAMFR
ncbi:helix-turn-helix transcriptional regulator [Rhizobium bangladeshense]|uniref:helix-turn-helix domain-containing protein n=1 Tax=Rhizobium bangladeshense TaxID=1138189 RepID=UPI001C83CADE|nr:helix-turn-helix transcriptional regulator [Rhizobium bangladeshense]MBX4884820.1 helix-turn-helix transcriptional regulator [Rhizobium bangladeshense]